MAKFKVGDRVILKSCYAKNDIYHKEIGQERIVEEVHTSRNNPNSEYSYGLNQGIFYYSESDLELVEQPTEQTGDFIVEVGNALNSEFIQKAAFENGYVWCEHYDKTVRLTEAEAVCFTKKRGIHANSLSEYKTSPTLREYHNTPVYKFPEQAAEILKLLAKEDEIKVGDYVVITDDSLGNNHTGEKNGFVFKAAELSAQHTGVWVRKKAGQGFGVLISCVRKATPEEIVEAQKPKCPQITINGYKGEFFDSYVKFGCAEINKDLFIHLHALGSAKLDYSNRIISEVTIGSGKFTAAQIKEIHDYYLAKIGIKS